MIFRNFQRSILLAGLLCLLGGACGYAQGIEFMHNLDSALAKAKAENKIVFVDFYTSWCGPCKQMSNEVFPQKEAGDYYNSRFISCKVQCDDKGIGEAVGKKYKINAYPTLMFMDTNGNNIHSMAGGLDVKGLIGLAETATDPTKNQLSMVKEWEAGNRTQVFMTRYFNNLVRSYRNDKAKADFDAYFNSLSKEKKADKNTYELMQIVRVGPFSAPFGHIEKNRTDYYKTIGKPAIDSFIATSYLWYLKGVQATGLSNKDLAQFNKELAMFKAKKYPYYEEYAMFYSVFDSKDAAGKDDINLYMKRGTEFLAKYGEKNDSYTLSLASMLGNWTGRKDAGAAGITWMETLLARNRDPRYLNTYFYILWRNFQFNKAVEVGNEIRDGLVKNGRSTADIDKQIQMVKDLIVKYGG
ncbi:thioredoxin family protein [Chitinophaga sp. NPDC101104]|uniref:thioredoxin family protein n=1 Tax=Chitinophaga sp. NPDC101104 TaxID=3390561 RepID=UPI003CFC66D7